MAEMREEGLKLKLSQRIERIDREWRKHPENPNSPNYNKPKLAYNATKGPKRDSQYTRTTVVSNFETSSCVPLSTGNWAINTLASPEMAKISQRKIL